MKWRKDYKFASKSEAENFLKQSGYDPSVGKENNIGNTVYDLPNGRRVFWNAAQKILYGD